jgi:hypothetical protein
MVLFLIFTSAQVNPFTEPTAGVVIEIRFIYAITASLPFARNNATALEYK